MSATRAAAAAKARREERDAYRAAMRRPATDLSGAAVWGLTDHTTPHTDSHAWLQIERLRTGRYMAERTPGKVLLDNRHKVTPDAAPIYLRDVMPLDGTRDLRVLAR